MIVKTELWIFPCFFFVCAEPLSLRMLPGLPPSCCVLWGGRVQMKKLLQRKCGIFFFFSRIWFISHFLLLSLIDDYRIGSIILFFSFHVSTICRKELHFSANKQITALQWTNARVVMICWRNVSCGRWNSMKNSCQSTPKKKAATTTLLCLTEVSCLHTDCTTCLTIALDEIVENCSHSWILNWFSAELQLKNERERESPHRSSQWQCWQTDWGFHSGKKEKRKNNLMKRVCKSLRAFLKNNFPLISLWLKFEHTEQGLSSLHQWRRCCAAVAMEWNFKHKRNGNSFGNNIEIHSSIFSWRIIPPPPYPFHWTETRWNFA